MDADREHVVSVVLTHQEWEEFVKLQPQPSVWLRERIQDVVAEARKQGAPAPEEARVA
jgi:hypothetical protein